MGGEIEPVSFLVYEGLLKKVERCCEEAKNATVDIEYINGMNSIKMELNNLKEQLNNGKIEDPVKILKEVNDIGRTIFKYAGRYEELDYTDCLA